MTGLILLPPDYQPVAGPLVFLAGPIQGAPPWQTEALTLLRNLSASLHVASPRWQGPKEGFDYAAQVNWETHYLRHAAHCGAILFWLAREQTHYCDRAYAQTSRFELAEWKVRHERDQVKLVVGIEDGFSGARYIRHRLNQDCPKVPVVSTLADACQKVVALVQGTHLSEPNTGG